jgi:predicted secreted protein
MAKIKSFGARVYLNGILVGGASDISASGTDVAFIETTTHDTAGGYRLFLGGLKDGGNLEVSGKYNYSDSGQAEWKSEEGMRHSVNVILSDNNGLTFNVIVGGFQTSNPLDDAVEFMASAKITGEVFPVFGQAAVTGTLTDGTDTVTFENMDFDGIANGKIKYANDDGDEIEWDSANNRWVMTHADSTAQWRSTSATLTPILATGWTPVSPATGTPTIAGA